MKERDGMGCDVMREKIRRKLFDTFFALLSLVCFKTKKLLPCTVRLMQQSHVNQCDSG
jgi:hypothetical protein